MRDKKKDPEKFWIQEHLFLFDLICIGSCFFLRYSKTEYPLPHRFIKILEAHPIQLWRTFLRFLVFGCLTTHSTSSSSY